jgi:hypothetical protein
MNIFSSNKARTKKDHGVDEISRNGLVFIPDISGFTQLVASTDLITGKSITYELLATIIRYNTLKLEIAEIEGDAIFFFKWQTLPDITEIKEQFQTLKAAFDRKKAELEIRYNIPLDLQLKAIAHYGTMSEFFLGGFRKLYGEVVVEAHRLLKNNIPDRSYLLITDELTAAVAGNTPEKPPIQELRSVKLCELYHGLRNICYTYTA